MCAQYASSTRTCAVLAAEGDQLSPKYSSDFTPSRGISLGERDDEPASRVLRASRHRVARDQPCFSGVKRTGMDL